MIDLPKPEADWERLPLLERLLKLRDAYNQTIKILKSDAWVKEAESKLEPCELSWDLLNALYYQEFPFLHVRISWFRAQWSVLFSSFLKQVEA